VTDPSLGFYEFFAGGGMARAGLGEPWRCLFANDLDPMKAAAYRENFGGDHLVCGDVAKLTTADLPGHADLAWASFPCQDLSLAGDHAGLGEAASPAPTRSGTFWPFWSLMTQLRLEGRAPRVIVLENVLGVLTSRAGRAFAAIGEALAGAEYRFGALVVDAVRFVPQSRPRVFFVAVDPTLAPPPDLTRAAASDAWHPDALVNACAGLSRSARERWVWWHLPPPADRLATLADLIEPRPVGVRWHTSDETGGLLAMMTRLNRAKVVAAGRTGSRTVGCIYRRTRPEADGVRRQRAEVRFDGIAGCLRTPAGGSSRQTILIVEGEQVTSRLLSPREAARLMGLSDGYRMPPRYNDAYHVAGDGVCPPVVRYVAAHLVEPLIAAGRRSQSAFQAIHERQKQTGQHERQMDPDAPRQLAVREVLEVHETSQHMDGRDRDDRRHELQLEIAEVDVPHPLRLV
jgi:DNA (cytosine-5)-methyltransferase 1